MLARDWVVIQEARDGAPRIQHHRGRRPPRNQNPLPGFRVRSRKGEVRLLVAPPLNAAPVIPLRLRNPLASRQQQPSILDSSLTPPDTAVTSRSWQNPTLFSLLPPARPRVYIITEVKIIERPTGWQPNAADFIFRPRARNLVEHNVGFSLVTPRQPLLTPSGRQPTAHLQLLREP